MRLFTLLNKRTGESEILNGKILKIKIKDHGLFTDVFTDRAIWATSTVVSIVDHDGFLTIYTKSGSVYDFVDVSTIIPTYEKSQRIEDQCTDISSDIDIPETNEIPDQTDFNLVEKEVVRDTDIHYGNGHYTIKFIFDRTITEEEFIEFLSNNGYKLHDPDGWWDDHSEIYCKQGIWYYDWVKAYTD